MKKIGRYEVVEEVGRGAMGVVYKASDPTIGRHVAIKVLSLDSASEAGAPSAQEIFMREARAAGRLSHPGIVTIHDALEDTETKNNYIVMEFIPGRTLENVLLYGPPLSVERALNIIRQVAEALDYAHQQQVIHRDLKPANILLTDDGRAKITDFGIAKIMAIGASLRTATIMGTPSYMSPEQVTGGEVDARSDLFALGILAYLMLTGEKPFAGETAAVMFKIVYEDPVLPSQLKPELGAGYDYLILRCLVKDRSKRYGSAREFLDDLDDVQHGRLPRSEVRIPLAEIRSADRTLVAKGVHHAIREQMEPVPAKKWTWIIAGMGAGGVLLMALLGVGVLIYRQRHQPAPPIAVAEPASNLPAPQGTDSLRTTVGTPTTPTPLLPTSKSDERAVQKTKRNASGAQTPSQPQESKKPAMDGANASRSASASSKDKKLSASASASKAVLPSQPGVQPPRKAQHAANPAPNGKRVIQVFCKFDVEDAKLTLSNEGSILWQENLKGKKKSGMFHLKGGYVGSISRQVTIPARTQNLSVHVRLKDSSTIEKPFTLPAVNGPGVFHIDINGGRVTVRWTTSSHL